MQVCGVIKNDNQTFVKGIIAKEVQIDKENPRVEIEIEEIE
jgi:Holliday junction resolvase RusA-like endonuclease